MLTFCSTSSFQNALTADPTDKYVHHTHTHTHTHMHARTHIDTFIRGSLTAGQRNFVTDQCDMKVIEKFTNFLISFLTQERSDVVVIRHDPVHFVILQPMSGLLDFYDLSYSFLIGEVLIIDPCPRSEANLGRRTRGGPARAATVPASLPDRTDPTEAAQTRNF